jgi:chitin disaccharide deacetylase
MVAARKIVLCADDYAMSEGISRGIIELLGSGRLSATSVMTNMPEWGSLAPELSPFRRIRGIGLHLNLTTGRPLTEMPFICPAGEFLRLPELIQRAFTGRLPESEIREELDRQLDAFIEVMGQAPDFLDGHQHVHVLPVIRQTLLSVLSQRGLTGAVWLRDPSDGIVPIIRREVGANKALLVKGLAIGFRAAATAASFTTNEGFSGFSPLDPKISGERVITRAFSSLGSRPVIMCHPGYVEPSLRDIDPVVESRPAELAYLASEAFGLFMAERDFELVPRPA